MKIIPIALFAILTIWGSTLHSLWGDEAETALFARSIRTHGIPYGWDGANIMGHTDAVSLNSDLVNYSNPWPQYYVAALSFSLFGESAFTTRLPFVLFAIATIPILYNLAFALTKQKSIALIAMWIAALSVQLILFSYQARYYSLVLFWGVLFTYAAVKLSESLWAKIIFVLAGTVFAYSHYISFPLWYVALFLVFRKNRSWVAWYLGLGCIIALLFAPWFFTFRPFQYRSSPLMVPGLKSFFELLWIQITWAFGPLVRSNIIPLYLVPFGVFAWWRNRRTVIGKALMFLVVLPSLYLVFTAILTVLFIADNPFTATRYNVIVFPFYLAGAAIIIYEMMRWKKWVGVVLIAVFVFYKSFLFNYFGELLHPYKTNVDAVDAYLTDNAREGDTAFLNMDRDHEPLVFLLGKKIRFVNRISPGNPRLFPKNRQMLPKYLSLYLEEPDWVILMSKYRTNDTFATFDRRDLFPGVDLSAHYEEIVLPVYFSDLTRPELDVHAFTQVVSSYTEQVFLYRKVSVPQ